MLTDVSEVRTASIGDLQPDLARSMASVDNRNFIYLFVAYFTIFSVTKTVVLLGYNVKGTE
jgi:hypothetical protein